jgi:S1-C subfamily serine protease
MMQMDEQHGGDEQPGAWEAWTAAAQQPEQAEPASAHEPAEGERSGLDNAETAGQAAPAQPWPSAPPSSPAQPWPPAPPAPAGQTAAFTQPLGHPGSGYDYGRPSYGSSVYAAQPGGGYGPPPGGESGYGGYSQPPGGGSGYGQPPGGGSGYGQPPGGGSGYGQPPGGGSGYGGYGQPPGGGMPPGYGTPPGHGGPPRRRRGLATAITYIAVAALAATAGGLVVSFADSGNSSPPGASSGSGSGNNGGGNFGFPGGGSTSGQGTGGASISAATLQKVENAVEPGIVVINSNLQYNGSAAAGTGIVISRSGLVLTNNHVIDQTTGLSATVVATGQHYQAKWLGYDKGSDVAVIQLEGASGLRTAPLGNSSAVKVGDPVVGMGNAGGTGRISAVEGTITGVNQTITASDQGTGAAPERLTDMLQTDADIISGDSGGPLASTAGKVIGMDTAASSGSFTTQQQNVGFAIPVNKALTIAHQIISGKSGSGVQIGSAGFVGVIVAGGSNGSQSTETSPQAQLQQQEASQPQDQFGAGPQNGCVNGNQGGVPASIAPVPSGTLILGVICGTPAAQDGMASGDVITSVAGQQVSSPASLMSIMQGVHGGSSVKITWVTPSDQTISKTLTVAAAPPQ